VGWVRVSGERGTPAYLFGCNRAERTYYSVSGMQTLYLMKMTVKDTFIPTMMFGSLQYMDHANKEVL
jgi:hypothetical protein